MELKNALSTSSEASLLTRHKTYSITMASQGSVILPPSLPLVKPNSSSDILRSSVKTVVPRYAKGTSNRSPSAAYTTQWPSSATIDGAVLQHSSSDVFEACCRRRAPAPADKDMRRKRLTLSSSTSAEETKGSCGTSCLPVAGKGRCIVYTDDGTRFELPLAFLGSTVFGELLRMSQEEFGFAGLRNEPCVATYITRVLLPRDGLEVNWKMQ
ncbi:hypothetical protein TRIUR3_00782 [Triticum urartu]|uniref:Auxin-responsive protein SAUR36 n=1 Tax=Triticum urartu TaxID=4572 RepID=M7Z8C5_TRIUA|nr:hypothetical protein TRIUR3_00782 [Triticum urartu]